LANVGPAGKLYEGFPQKENLYDEDFQFIPHYCIAHFLSSSSSW
jgi:hypothetical protein